MSNVRFVIDNMIDACNLTSTNTSIINTAYRAEYSTDIGDAEVSLNNTLVYHNNSVLFTPLVTDPKFYIGKGRSHTQGILSIDPSIYTKVRMRVRLVSGEMLDSTVNPPRSTWEGNCWWQTATHPATSNLSVKVLDPGLSDGNWHVLEWDFSGNSAYINWPDFITSFRMDLVRLNVGDPVFEIDWVDIISDKQRYGIENIKESSRGAVYRSDDCTPTEILGTTNTSYSINTIILGRHNFSELVELELYLYSDPAYTTEVWSSGKISLTYEQAASDLYKWGEFDWGTIPWGENKKDLSLSGSNILAIYLATAPVSAKSFRLLIHGETVYDHYIFCNDPIIYCNNTTIYCNQLLTQMPLLNLVPNLGIDYFELGRVFLGKYIEPEYNISFGHTISWNENTDQYRPSSGTLQSSISSKNREFSFDLNTISENDRKTIQKELIKCGLSKDFYISIFPEHSSKEKEIDYSGIVKFTKMPAYSEIQNRYYKSSYTVEEA